MREVDLAKDLGGAQLSEVVSLEGSRALGKSDVWVYVLDVTFFGEVRWTSVHTTLDGARARLEQKVDEYEVHDAYEAEAPLRGPLGQCHCLRA